MSGLFSILEKIKTKPGMYLGRTSVSDLFMFLVGYETARSELGIDLTVEEESFYSDFQPWLQKKLNITTNSSWAKIIMLNCHDENTGFQRFFEFLETFLLEKNQDGSREKLNLNKELINV
jgi:hypothetical protein